LILRAGKQMALLTPTSGDEKAERKRLRKSPPAIHRTPYAIMVSAAQ
jgi:hypothetical protein